MLAGTITDTMRQTRSAHQLPGPCGGPAATRAPLAAASQMCCAVASAVPSSQLYVQIQQLRLLLWQRLSTSRQHQHHPAAQQGQQPPVEAQAHGAQRASLGPSTGPGPFPGQEGGCLCGSWACEAWCCSGAAAQCGASLPRHRLHAWALLRHGAHAYVRSMCGVCGLAKQFNAAKCKRGDETLSPHSSCNATTRCFGL